MSEGPRAFIKIRDKSGEYWSIGARLTENAYKDEGGEIGVIAVPVDEVLRDGVAVGLYVIEEDDDGITLRGSI